MTLTDQASGTPNKALATLSKLEGVWHGDGTGPYGPIAHKTHADFRARWLLLTGTIFVPDTDTVTYVSTQVFGYDDDGEINLRYQSTEPTVGDQPLTFEGPWRAGPRASSPAK